MKRKQIQSVKQQPTMRLHLWLETTDGLFFGTGRAQLLAKIDSYGSIKKAADDLGMSYRAAWGKIKKTETVLGEKLIVRVGKRREGYELTEYGRTLLNSFNVWFKETENLALLKAREHFPWKVKSFNESISSSSSPSSSR